MKLLAWFFHPMVICLLQLVHGKTIPSAFGTCKATWNASQLQVTMSMSLNWRSLQTVLYLLLVEMVVSLSFLTLPLEGTLEICSPA